MDGAIGVLGPLIGISSVVFIVISLVVLLSAKAMGARAARGAADGPVWFGGPGGGEHGVSDSGVVLLDRRPAWIDVPDHDWPALAGAAEPGRACGGASGGW
ncbi:hypothetical protein [Spongiactinospora gelatinilytica]|nr:hypothetical protein [Spongiactinospora gelatinilytica]